MAFTDFTNCPACDGQVKHYNGEGNSHGDPCERWTFKCSAGIMLWKGEYTVEHSCISYYASKLKEVVEGRNLGGTQ